MIKKILEDWNNRVGGNLNHKKESHLFELGSMLWEQGWSSEQIGELIKNLVEQESKFKGRSKETGKIRYFKDKESMDKAIDAGTVEPIEEPDKKKDDEPEQDPTKLSGPKDFERPGTDTKKSDDKKTLDIKRTKELKRNDKEKQITSEKDKQALENFEKDLEDFYANPSKEKAEQIVEKYKLKRNFPSDPNAKAKIYPGFLPNSARHIFNTKSGAASTHGG